MFVDFGLYSSLMKPMETLPDTSVSTAFAQIFWRGNTYKLKQILSTLDSVARERLLICFFNISISYWSWSLSKVIAQNLWLLKGIWSWRLKCHINWLLGKFIVLFKNHRNYVKKAPLCAIVVICNDPFSMRTLKQARQMHTVGNGASFCHLKLSCFQVPKVPSVTYTKLFNRSI